MQDRISILHVGKFYPPYRGGMESHLETLARALRPHADLKVLVSSEDRRTHKEQIDGIEVVRAATPLWISSAPISPAMFSVLRENRADIIHVHLPNPCAVLACLASGTRSRVIATYHSDTLRQVVLGSAFQAVLNRFLKRCDAIIATSPNYIESSPSLSRLRSRCRVIPFGIEFTKANETTATTVARLRSQFGERIVLTVGRHVSYKGFDVLVEAMKDVRGRLLMVGSGPLKSKLEQMAMRRGVQDRIVFLGNVPDVTPLYHAADVFVLPSIARTEAFGLVQVEAMAAGKPVVNTDIKSGVPFVSVHGETGLTVPVQDPGALAQAINLLLDDAPLRAQYGAAAKRRAHEMFHLDAMVGQTLALYHDVLGRKEPELRRDTATLA